MFEVALFGHCLISDELSAFHFKPEREKGVFEIACQPHEGMQDKQFLYLGDQREHMHSKIEEALATDPDPLAAFVSASSGRPLSRIPRYVIQDHIDDESFPTIGGDLQLGIADKLGFRGLALCKPGGSGQAVISYLGRNLTDDLQYVGRALVGSQAIV
jgi:hypothetical protein